LVAALGGLINAVSSSGLTPIAVVVVAPFVAIAWYLLDFGFRSEDRQRFGARKHRGQQFDIAGSARFSQVFEPVQEGTCQLARILASGTSAGFTPVSNRPIEKYMVRHAFDDAWLPADLLHEPQPAGSGEPTGPEHVVIVWRDWPDPLIFHHDGLESGP
jgi:hypothetical protein